MAIKSFSPTRTGAQNLGSRERKWGTIYAETISDGTTSVTPTDIIAIARKESTFWYGTQDMLENESNLKTGEIYCVYSSGTGSVAQDFSQGTKITISNQDITDETELEPGELYIVYSEPEEVIED